jgi:hypothetical protein
MEDSSLRRARLTSISTLVRRGSELILRAAQIEPIKPPKHPYLAFDT